MVEFNNNNLLSCKMIIRALNRNELIVVQEIAHLTWPDTFKDILERHKIAAALMTTNAGTTEQLASVQQYEDIKKFFLSLYFEGRAHALFIPASLNDLAENIFTNDNIRDFVLNWTDSAMVSLSVQDFSLEQLRETISQGICQNKPFDENGELSPLCLVNAKVAATINIAPQYVNDILKANSWLLCITILYLFMSELDITTVY